MESVAEGEGAPCFTENARTVLLPEVTVEAFEESVEYLWEKGYFSHWKPDDKFKSPDKNPSL
jgi:hypothetical protein